MINVANDIDELELMVAFSIIVAEQQEPASHRTEANAEGAGKFFH